MSDKRSRASTFDRSDCNGLAPATSEPAVLRYLCLLWRHRVLIAVVSMIPAVIVALALCLWPRKYTAVFVYERPLAESQYSVLLQRFYSQENLDKIAGRLREQGLADYAGRLDKARFRQAFGKLIRFEVSPMYPRRLQTTDPATSLQISNFQAGLLLVRVFGDSEREVLRASAIVMGNIEDVLPLYDIRNDLRESLQRHRRLAAEIEDKRFTLTLDLEKEQAKLKKLQAVEGVASEGAQQGIVLQFNDVEGSHQFLPLSYQVRAVQSRIIELEETLAGDARKYAFYLQVLDLNGRLLDQIEQNVLTYSTSQQFLDSLREQLQACEKTDETALTDYLKSYIRKTENLVLVNTRAGERPVIYPVGRGVVRNSGLTFAVSLMAAMLAAVLSEYRRC
ncbi:MAG: hypothetical protein KBE65_15795 [Phycisphaerae bacterium]|nr:hypothetical protein [Phycisphaerae bacterium]